MRISSAKATPTVAALTTIAVSMSVCGRGFTYMPGSGAPRAGSTIGTVAPRLAALATKKRMMAACMIVIPMSFLT